MGDSPVDTVVAVAVVVDVGGVVAAHRGGLAAAVGGQQVVVQIVEPVELQAQQSVPQGGVQADVGRAGLGPGQRGIGNAAGIHGAVGRAVEHPLRSEGVGAEVGIGRHNVVAEQSEGAAHLQVVEPSPGAFHEVFARNAPGGGEGGEEAPALARAAEVVGAVVAAAELGQVSVGVVIFQTEHVARRARVVVDARDGGAARDGLAVGKVGYLWERHVVDVAREVGTLVVVDFQQAHRVDVVAAELSGVFQAELARELLGGVLSVAHVVQRFGRVARVVVEDEGAEVVRRHRHRVGLVGRGQVLALRTQVVVGAGEGERQAPEPARVVAQAEVGVEFEAVGASVARLVDGREGAIGNAGVVGQCSCVQSLVLFGQKRVHHNSLVPDRKPSYFFFIALASVVGTTRGVARCLASAHGAHGPERQLPVASHLRVDVGTDVITTVVEVGDIALLAHETARKEVVDVVGSALQGHVVLLVVARSEHLSYVVHVVPAVRRVVVEHGLDVLAGEDGRVLVARLEGRSGEFVHQVGHVVVVGVLRSVHECGEVGVDGDSVLAVVGHPRLALPPLLGGDDDHAAGGVEAIYGCRGPVFQHRNALDVVGVDVVHRARHAVDDVERAILRAADAQRGEVVARLARGLHGGQTGHAAAQHVGYVGRRRLQQLVALERRDGAGERLLLGRAVAHDHYVVERRRLVGQRDVDGAAVAHPDTLGLHSYIRKRQVVGTVRLYAVVAVQVGDDTVLDVSVSEHGHSGERCARCVFHDAPDRLCRRVENEGEQQGQCQRQSLRKD